MFCLVRNPSRYSNSLHFVLQGAQEISVADSIVSIDFKVNYMGQRPTGEAFTWKEKLIDASNYSTLSICLLRSETVFDN